MYNLSKLGSIATGSFGSCKRNSIKDYELPISTQCIAEIRRQRLYQHLKSADASIVWEHVSSGYRIVDLQLDRFTQALRFVLINFCRTEPLSKAVGLYDDSVSVKSFLTKVFNQMTENLSFCAFQDGTSEMVGVLVASEVDKLQGRSIIEYPGDAFRKIMNLQKYAFRKTDLLELLETEKLVKINIICVRFDHQKKGIGTALLRSCLTRLSTFATVCVGEFTSAAAQTIAERLQFQMLYELPYQTIGSVRATYQVFQNCYPQNYSLACMAIKISPPPQYEPAMSISTQSRRSKEMKPKKKK